MKIAVTGANGQLGRIVISQLKKRVKNETIVALVRDVEKAKDLEVELRKFDYDNKESLSKQLNGVDRLLLISGSEIGKRTQQHKNVIEAAKKAGVKHLVYTSLLHLDKTSLNLAGEHIETEKLINESGLEYTILRNGWYSENYTASIPGALQGGAFLGSAENGKIASAPRADYAEAAAIVLTKDDYKNKVLELAGDEAYTLTNLASEISIQIDRKIPYQNLPEDEYATILKQVGLPEPLALGLASWDVSASKDDLFDDSKTLSTLLGRPTTPIKESVKKVLMNKK
jgi:NAD(P)H dehydrogenase (quinone)